jgi:hypothetical protein
LYDGASDTTGVNETNGGAKLAGRAVRELGLSTTVVREEIVVCEFWGAPRDGLLGSEATLLALEAVLAVTADATETAEERGPVREFFILENSAVTMVYDD